jgi:IS30 family transposase
MAFLKKRLSPVQISGRLKLESAKWSISHETIYNWIYKVAPAFKSCLRWKSRRRQRRGVRRRRGLHKYPRRLIDQRPEAANQRLEPGHWERDLLEGQRGGPALLVLQDRFTRIVIIKKVNSKHCDHINQVTAEALRSHLVLSMTNDNGIEFGHYEQLEKLLKARVFYCHAYTSWERGSIENANGLLRQYFPKRTDFKKVDEQTLKRAQDELNHRPKKILGFRSPTEVHEGKKIRMIRSEKYYQSQLHQREQREFEEEMIREIGYYLKLTKDVYVALDP